MLGVSLPSSLEVINLCVCVAHKFSPYSDEDQTKYPVHQHSPYGIEKAVNVDSTLNWPEAGKQRKPSPSNTRDKQASKNTTLVTTGKEAQISRDNKQKITQQS